jgi:hypothetical protein
MTDFDAIISAAQDQKTFSVLDVAKGRGYPQDIVTVYTDAESGYRAARLIDDLNDIEDNDERDRVAAEIRDLLAKVEESALTFHMRGIGQGTVEAINREAGGLFEDTITGPGAQWCNFKYIAENIISVTNADGAVDQHHWSVEDVEALHDLLPKESFARIAQMTDELTFASAYFDATTTSDFS